MKVKVCSLCGGKMTDRSVDVVDTVGGRLVILRGIAAEVCVRCGERVYSEVEMRKMEELRGKIQGNLVKPATVEEIEVFTV